LTAESIPNIRLGTSSWSSQDWVGPFYPPGTPPAEFITEYARHFDTVEVDATFYRIPSSTMVKNWRDRTPPGFLFAAKIPQIITHEKVLQNCEADLKQFLGAMDLLGDKLGPLLFQFPYFNKKTFARPEDFFSRLSPFLDKLPSGYSFAVEVRNRNFIDLPLLSLLGRKKIALALIDHPWMTPIDQLMKKFDLATADFCYIRFLGDRKGIEEKTKHWDKVIIGREHEMGTWIPAIRRLIDLKRVIYAYFNNHYAGFAPGSIQLFQEIWRKLSSH
jgi:uncharacterized protein YecE (DUF72 family)